MKKSKKLETSIIIFFLCYLITGILCLIISGFYIKAGNLSLKTAILFINGILLIGVSFWSLKKTFEEREKNFFVLNMGYLLTLIGTNAMLSKNNLSIMNTYAPLIWGFGILEIIYGIYLINKKSTTGVIKNEDKDA